MTYDQGKPVFGFVLLTHRQIVKVINRHTGPQCLSMPTPSSSKTSAKNGHSLLDAHLLLILALLGLQVQDNEDGAGHDHCHDVGPPARSGHLQSSGHRSLQLKRFWHCCSCGASQRAGGHGSATKHEGLSAQSHKGQCQEEGRKQHKLGSHWSNKG